MKPILLVFFALALVGCEGDNPEFSGREVINPERTVYPEGPYGQDVGKVLPNWRFEDGQGTLTLQDIRAGTLADTLVILPSSEGFRPSINLLPRAQELHDIGRSGTVQISVVFETKEKKPASLSDAQAWSAAHGIEWAVIADTESQLRLAFRNDLETAVFVNLKSMKRLSISSRKAIETVLFP